MPKKSYRQAINEAIRQEMERDHRVIVMGEDVAGGAGAPGEQDAWGGPLGVTKGLMPKFGRDRVLDTPISESAFIGAAIGAAATGLRPIADLMFVDFMGVCFDQIFNQAAKFRYMFGGKAVTPVVIRTMYGAGFRAASPAFAVPLSAVHPHPRPESRRAVQPVRSQGPDDPGDPRRRSGDLLRAQGDVRHRGDVPDEPYAIRFGEANVTREGDDVTIITLGRMVNFANEAADNLARKGVGVTVVDLRTTSPLDVETVLETAQETGRVVVVDEAHPRCSMAADIAALVAEQAFGSLKAPIKMVTAPHAPVPFSPALEDLYIPSVARIEAAVQEVLGYSSARAAE